MSKIPPKSRSASTRGVSGAMGAAVGMKADLKKTPKKKAAKPAARKAADKKTVKGSRERANAQGTAAMSRVAAQTRPTEPTKTFAGGTTSALNMQTSLVNPTPDPLNPGQTGRIDSTHASPEPLSDQQVAERQVRDVLKEKGVAASNETVRQIAEKQGRGDDKSNRIGVPPYASQPTSVERGPDGKPTEWKYEGKLTPAFQTAVVDQAKQANVTETEAKVRSHLDDKGIKASDAVVKEIAAKNADSLGDGQDITPELSTKLTSETDALKAKKLKDGGIIDKDKVKASLETMRDAAKLAGRDVLADSLDAAKEALDSGDPSKATSVIANLKSSASGMQALGGLVSQLSKSGKLAVLGNFMGGMRIVTDTPGLVNNVAKAFTGKDMYGEPVDAKAQRDAAFDLVEDTVGMVQAGSTLAQVFGMGTGALAANPVLMIPMAQARLMKEVVNLAMEAQAGLYEMGLKDTFGTTDIEKLKTETDGLDFDFDPSRPNTQQVANVDTMVNRQFKDLGQVNTSGEYGEFLEKNRDNIAPSFTKQELHMIQVGRGKELSPMRLMAVGLAAQKLRKRFIEHKRTQISNGAFNE